jgi:hypothetical protein
MRLFLLKNKIPLFITTILMLFPVFSFAQKQNVTCSPKGYTIETINGVFTSLEGAIENSSALQRKLLPTYNNEPLTVDYLLNPSHIAGIGDGVKVVYQKIFENEIVRDYDLVEMLKSASEKVKTQKVLLVAHSQGNFYANSFYDTVSGQPGNASANSIAVYSVATPASRVAGGGKWLTSDTDKVISDFVGSIPFKKIMSPNTHIELKPGDDERGHNFSDVYMKYQSEKIVSGIRDSLDKLKSDSQSEDLPCITPPKLTTAHIIEGKVFAVVDPVAETTKSVVVDTASGVYSTGLALVNTVKDIASTIGSGIRSATDFAFGGNNNEASVVLATTNDKSEQSSADKQNTSVIADVANDTPLISKQSEQGDETVEEEVAQSQIQQGDSTTDDSLPITPTPTTNNISEPKVNFGNGISPGFGGGAPAPIQQQTSSDPPVDSELVTESVSEPEAVLISVTSPGDFSNPFATTTILFSGTSTPGSIISNSLSQATTTSSAEGDWSFFVSGFPSGTSTVRFFATILGNENIGQQEIILSVDIPTIPAPSITSHTFPLQLRTKAVTFSGTSTPGFTIKNNFNDINTIASSTKAWSLPFSDLPEGTTTIKFFAVDQSGAQSGPKEATLNVYTIQPKATGVSIVECSHSLQSPPQSCLLPAGSATISWSVNSPNYNYFEIIKGTNFTGYSTIATTTETSVTVSTVAGPYDIKVVAVSIFGNRDSSTSGNTAYFTASYMPVIINEVAWSGTDASSYDEWIELKNRTNMALNLSSFAISAEDGAPDIALSGTIPSQGYFLIARGEAGDTFSDVTVDLAVPFSGIGGGAGLVNGGEVLNLVFGGGASTTTIDQTPALADCSGWCGGNSSPDYKTMERKHADTIGSDKNNWGTNDGSYIVGHDNAGNAINGTPKARNSVSMGKAGFYCDPYTASFIEGEYYIPTLSGSAYFNCRFLSYGLNGYKFANLYRGTVGSSTSIYEQNMSTFTEYEKLINVNPANFVQGENYFVAIYESPLLSGSLFNTAEMNQFKDFFTGRATTSSHERYGVLNWRYGVAP